MDPDCKPMEAPTIPPLFPRMRNTLFSTISTGINFNKYDIISVEVIASHLQMPFTSFDEMNWWDLLLQNLLRTKYAKATPVQKYAGKTTLACSDLMACT
ncbi:hypothetical protein MRX96_003212 [Rhipicephalus microplus]|uniref:Uncharacterized protein n=1 Tax=Rhipicephalus microplus TaxID=6941 RepID=A0A9J6EI27_RHIMP|nr:hypothetical protein HPB51_016251 [Rhipicephalus microplus]